METKKGLTVKLFIGSLFVPQLKEALEKNVKWRQEKVTGESPLKEIRFQNKVYIGLYLPEEKVTVTEVRNRDAELRTLLQTLCPNINCDSLKTSILPQVFLN